MTTAVPIPAHDRFVAGRAVRRRTGSGGIVKHKACEIRTANPVYDPNIVT
jgi:hypothetical protein